LVAVFAQCANIAEEYAEEQLRLHAVVASVLCLDDKGCIISIIINK
jgi:hypothetical protein